MFTVCETYLQERVSMNGCQTFHTEVCDTEVRERVQAKYKFRSQRHPSRRYQNGPAIN